MNEKDRDSIKWITVNGRSIPISENAQHANGHSAENAISAETNRTKTHPPQKVYGFENKARKNTRDHREHCKAMGFKNQDDYENAAIHYWERGEGTVYRGKRRDNFVKYNPKTQEYVVVKGDSVKTFYTMSIKKFNKIKQEEGFEEWIE